MLTYLCFFKHEFSFAQKTKDTPVRNCKSTVLEFYNYAKAKDYTNAYEPWLESFEKCPASSKMIYKYGLKIIEDRYQKSSAAQKELERVRIDSIYAQRIQYFPENLGKVYSDWTTSLEKRGASKTKVFEKLELAFHADPAQMSIKNIAKYFQHITTTYKDSNLQNVLDTYDTAIEAVNKKIDYHSKRKDKLDKKVADGNTLTRKEAIKLKNDIIILRGLGQVEGILYQIGGDATTCETLIPLYTKGFETHKNDAKWLRRAASRLNAKSCIETSIYKKLVDAYVHIDASMRAPNIIICSSFYPHKISEKSIKGMIKAIESEKDPYKRGEYYYRIAHIYWRKNKILSRQYAYKALKERPSLGKAYLLIARLYAASANTCGTDEFSKRMVFVAAADKAKKAKEVDPSITSLANKYIKSYLANAPRRGGWGVTNSDKEFQIKCWIGETVKIP